MTESTFVGDEAEVESAPSRKPLLLAGAGAGVLVLAGAGWLLLHGGGGSSANDSFVVPHHTAKVATAPKAAAAKAPARAAALPAASAVNIGRDPFAALYIVPASSTGGAGATGTTSASTSTGTAGTTPATSTSSMTTPTTRYPITLTRVTTDRGGAKLFTFSIGTTSTTVLPAQRFGTYGELVVLTFVENSRGAVTGAVLQVGDDNPITVPIGVKTSVQ